MLHTVIVKCIQHFTPFVIRRIHLLLGPVSQGQITAELIEAVQPHEGKFGMFYGATETPICYVQSVVSAK